MSDHENHDNGWDQGRPPFDVTAAPKCIVCGYSPGIFVNGKYMGWRHAYSVIAAHMEAVAEALDDTGEQMNRELAARMRGVNGLLHSAGGQPRGPGCCC